MDKTLLWVALGVGAAVFLDANANMGSIAVPWKSLRLETPRSTLYDATAAARDMMRLQQRYRGPGYGMGETLVVLS